MEMIGLEECRDGNLYRIGARNSDLGVFLEKEKGFVINRHKFGENFLFVEYHWDTGPPHGTALCFEDLGKAEDFPWEEYFKAGADQKQKMLQYLNDCYEKYDISFKRALRYCLKSIDSNKTAEEIVDLWAIKQDDEMKARLVEAVQKEKDKRNVDHDTKTSQ